MFKIQRHADNYFFKKIAEDEGAEDLEIPEDATYVENVSEVGPGGITLTREAPTEPSEGATIEITMPPTINNGVPEVGQGKTLYYRRLVSGGPLVWANFDGPATSGFPIPKVYWPDGGSAKYITITGNHGDIADCRQPGCGRWDNPELTAAAIDTAWIMAWLDEDTISYVSMSDGPGSAEVSRAIIEEQIAAAQTAAEEAAAALTSEELVDEEPIAAEEAGSPATAPLEKSPAWERYIHQHGEMIRRLYLQRENPPSEDTIEREVEEGRERAENVWRTWMENAEAWGKSTSHDDWKQWYRERHMEEGDEKWQHGRWSTRLRYLMRPDEAVRIMSNPPAEQSAEVWDSNGKKAGIINDLVSLSNNLDQRGYRKESSLIDNAISKIAKKL